MKITILSTNFELTPAIKDYVQKKMDMLDKYYNGVIIGRVELERTTQHHQKGKIFRCEVNLDLAHHDMILVEKTEEEMYKAIDKVKDHLKRQLSDLHKRETKRH